MVFGTSANRSVENQTTNGVNAAHFLAHWLLRRIGGNFKKGLGGHLLLQGSEGVWVVGTVVAFRGFDFRVSCGVVWNIALSVVVAVVGIVWGCGAVVNGIVAGVVVTVVAGVVSVAGVAGSGSRVYVATWGVLVVELVVVVGKAVGGIGTNHDAVDHTTVFVLAKGIGYAGVGVTGGNSVWEGVVVVNVVGGGTGSARGRRSNWTAVGVAGGRGFGDGSGKTGNCGVVAVLPEPVVSGMGYRTGVVFVGALATAVVGGWGTVGVATRIFGAAHCFFVENVVATGAGGGGVMIIRRGWIAGAQVAVNGTWRVGVLGIVRISSRSVIIADYWNAMGFWDYIVGIPVATCVTVTAAGHVLVIIIAKIRVGVWCRGSLRAGMENMDIRTFCGG